MLSLEEAQEKILELVKPLGAETIDLGDATRRILAQDTLSTVDLPPFDNSAMDGYAVRSEDTVGASLERPVTVRLIAKVAAGDTFSGPIQSGTCARIFTGSPLPSGADAVIMQEDTRPHNSMANHVELLDTVRPWENIRFHGEDIKKGAKLVSIGTRLDASQLSLLAAVGTTCVSVGKIPSVALLATGNELVEAGNPLLPGKIYESNRLGLSASVRQAGASPKMYPLVEDTLEATQKALEKAFSECDCVVTSGGVSVGEFDFVKAAFEKLGGEMNFWKVSIRPGKPFVFGRWKEKFLFGLPGNPVSALVTFFLLVRPALLRMQGAKNCSPSVSYGKLAEAVKNNGDRRHFVRVHIDALGNVQPSGVQASHILSSLAAANGLIDLAPKTHLPQGTAIAVLRWD